MFDSSEVFSEILRSEAPFFTNAQVDRLVRFRNLVLEENQIQNLTRLLSPRDFFEGHVLDVVELERSGFLVNPLALDLGAGVGVPGLLHAILYEKESLSWISSDSEKMKADFLQRVIDSFQLINAAVTSLRAEEYLSTHPELEVTVVSRAVGTVTKIYGWLSQCSTWNKLILLKGPRWDEEWTDFQRSSRRNRLKLLAEHHYEVGEDKKKRRIVLLERLE